MIYFKSVTPFNCDKFVSTPNFSNRKWGQLRYIILHDTADQGNENGALEWLTSPKSKVSAHMLLSRTGVPTRLVEDKYKAWHAGESKYGTITGLNEYALGIEMANKNDGEPHTEAQYCSLAVILAHYCIQGIQLHPEVLGHYHIAPGRKTDPGGYIAAKKINPGFDWAKINLYTEYTLLHFFGFLYRGADRQKIENIGKYIGKNMTAFYLNYRDKNMHMLNRYKT